MRQIAGLLFIVLLTTTASAFDHNHEKWTKLLKVYQNSQGLVNYKKLKTDVSTNTNHEFNQYVTELQNVALDEFKNWSRPEKMAFLINAYNALTVKLIIDHYPVKSIKKIGGMFKKPWDVEFFSLFNGMIKSIDPIEHKWLRPQFKDYRIHAAVNCASISCPPLRNEAFVGAKLDEQLDDQMREWLKDPSRNRIDVAKKKLYLSKIFDWYESDFKDWGGGVVSVVNKYLPQPLPRDVASQIQVDYLDYDWNLNEVK